MKLIKPLHTACMHSAFLTDFEKIRVNGQICPSVDAIKCSEMTSLKNDYTTGRGVIRGGLYTYNKTNMNI